MQSFFLHWLEYFANKWGEDDKNSNTLSNINPYKRYRNRVMNIFLEGVQNYMGQGPLMKSKHKLIFSPWMGSPN